MNPGSGAPAWLMAATVIAGAVIGWSLTLFAGRFLETAREVPFPFRLWASGAAALLLPALLERFGLAPEALAYAVLVAGCVVLAVIDLQEKRLPNALILPTTVGFGLLLAACALLRATPGLLIGAAAGGAGLLAVYLVLAVLSGGGLGGGDVKLAPVLGLAAGYLGLRVWLVALVAGFLINAIASLVALALRRTTLQSDVPFGPAMVAGAFLAILLA